jgi:hypothetical protein
MRTSVSLASAKTAVKLCGNGSKLRSAFQSCFSRLFFLFDSCYAVKTGANKFADLKEVLAPALGLLGTVIGYYFGRVPAERHADTARDAAAAAHERELKVRQQVHAGLCGYSRET